MAGDAVSTTARGRLIRIDTRKPSMTVLKVAIVWPATVGPMAIVSFQISLGAGSR